MDGSAPALPHLPPGTKATKAKGVDWASLKLSPVVMKVLEEVLHFDSLTPVQSATIPHFLEHKDVAVEVCIQMSSLMMRFSRVCWGNALMKILQQLTKSPVRFSSFGK